MATEYGYRSVTNQCDFFDGWSQQAVEAYCRSGGFVMVAREVSEPRIVSIRA